MKIIPETRRAYQIWYLRFINNIPGKFYKDVRKMIIYLNIPMNVHHHCSRDEFDSNPCWCTLSINLFDKVVRELQYVDVYHLVLWFPPPIELIVAI
jgi:hypothetical protein